MIRVAAESAEGKRASTEDDESLEFSFPIMHVEEGFDEGYLHSDSYGHQSRVTPERSKFLTRHFYQTFCFPCLRDGDVMTLKLAIKHCGQSSRLKMNM